MAVALVTGAAIRVGRAIALQLAQEGFDIALHYNGSEEAANQTAVEIEALGRNVICLKADLNALNETESKFLMESAAKLGELKVLVNSAAIFPEKDGIHESLSHWDPVMNINLKAPLLLAQAFAFLVKQDSHIINILDNRINTPDGDSLIYRLSKSALWQLTECLGKDLAPKIQVNGLALGAIMAPPGADDLHFKRMANHIPLKRTGSPQAVAEAVSFLVSQNFITGAVIPIDGGEFI